MKAPQISADVGPEPEIGWVSLDQIEVNRDYQRDLRSKRVNQILREFSWSKFGALTLAQREDGRYNVYDGQHRHAAAMLHPAISAVPAVICAFDGGREEAEAFIGVNVNRTAVTPIERYYAGVEAGDPAMMAICAVLDEAGCEVARYAGDVGPTKTASVTGLQRAIQSYGEAATKSALLYARLAWPSDKEALKGTIITALSRIVKNNRRVIDEKRMADALKTTTPRKLAGDAETLRRLRGGDASTSISHAICEIYNRGIRTNHISIGVKP